MEMRSESQTHRLIMFHRRMENVFQPYSDPAWAEETNCIVQLLEIFIGDLKLLSK
jgi:hypothetical protein